MATAFPSLGSGTVEISDVVRCILCKGDDVTSPLIQLNCFHVCHRNCLKKSLRNLRPGSKFNCEECQFINLLPANGIEGFPEELLHYKMKEIAAIFSNTCPKCKICEEIEEEAVSTHYCITCKLHMCSTDTKRHKLLPNHKIITNGEIQTEEYLSQALTSKIAPCSIHPNDVLKSYCQDCKVPLCQICNGTKHKLHKSISLQKAAEKFKEEFANKVKDILPLKYGCEIGVITLEKILNDIEQTSKQQMDECKKWGEDIKLAVDKIVEKRVLEISTEMIAQKDKIKKLTERKNDQNKQFQSAKKYIETTIKYASESDILQMCKKVEANLDNFLKQNTEVQITVNKTKVDMKNVKEVEKDLEGMLKVETEKETYQIPPKLRGFELEAEWTTGDWMSGVIVDGEEVIAVRGNKIEVYGMKGELKGEIECQGLENAWDVELMNKQLVVSDCKRREILVLDRKGNIKRNITLPAQERVWDEGQLGIAVDQSKEDIYISSSFCSTVYKCGKGQTQAHPFITTGLGGPEYLCMTPTSEIIVSNWTSHTVCKYSSEGALVWKYGRKGSGEGEVYGPTSICVNFLGQVFVCDSENNRIHHLSPDGKFLSCIDIEHPQAITSDKDKILISQHSSKISVMKCLYK